MQWFDRVPKVELHVHLEGSIPLPALWELVRKYGGDSEVGDIEALRRRFAYRDFPQFIQTWIWKDQFLREYEDFAFLSEAVARDWAAQNIRYAETFFTPRGFDVGKLSEAVRAGFSRVPDIEIALIADLCRDFGPEQGAKTLAAAHEARSFGIVGIGIGGSEQLFPPEPFAPVYAEARRLGFHTTAHAGEAAGAASVWGAVRSLQVERIGHATRAEEDPQLLDHLVEAGIPLELCPLSNVRTGVVASPADHPVRRYFDRGLKITINSDDPKMFANSLAEEYALLADTFGFSASEIRALILNAVDASFLSTEKKQELADSLCQDPGWAED